MSVLTLDRWIRDRARATPERVAIDYLDGQRPTEELDARSNASRRAPRAGSRARSAGGDADRRQRRPRRRVLRLREGGARCCRSTGASLPRSSRTSSTTRSRPSPSSSVSTRTSRPPPWRSRRPAGAPRARGPFPAGGVAAEAAPRDDDPPPRLHLRPTGRPKGAPHARQLLLDERRLRPRHRRPRRRRRAPGAAAIPLRGLERAAAPRVVEGRDGRARAGVRRRALPRADREQAGDDDDGRPRELPLHRPGAGVRVHRPLVAPPRGRRRRSDAETLLRHVAVARGRDRPGIRSHRGGPQRPLPSPEEAVRKQGCAGSRTRTSTSRSATRRRARRSTGPRPASSSSAARTCSPATGATRRRPPPRSPTASS